MRQDRLHRQYRLQGFAGDALRGRRLLHRQASFSSGRADGADGGDGDRTLLTG